MRLKPATVYAPPVKRDGLPWQSFGLTAGFDQADEPGTHALRFPSSGAHATTIVVMVQTFTAE
eukprot:scaffold3473_cov385-Prasinococcus_capsulatus_cf.AAC.5